MIGRRVRLVGSRLRDISRQFESNRTDTYRFYGTWQIPDKTPRARALRVIPETDDSFNRLFGLREDSESMHHHLKMMLPNGGARSVGRHRQAVGQAGRRSSALRTKNASSASSPSGVMSAAILPIGSVPPSGCGKSVENA